VEIVRTPPDQVGCKLLRRWVIEQFFAWANRNRRLAKDFEGTIASATACFHAACVMPLARRLARSG
jgi:putative transposase